MSDNYCKIPIIICGPTATGKSDLAVALSRALDGEIISADSMQIYKGMNVGTAKITADEMSGIPHYLIDFISPKSSFSVAEYSVLARNIVNSVLYSGKTPIIVGGTGLYINSLIYNYDFCNTSKDLQLRSELKAISEAEGNEELMKILYGLSPRKASLININDTKRLIRAIEVEKSGGTNETPSLCMDYLAIGLNFDREYLYEKINKRVDLMFENGLESEVYKLVFEEKLSFDMQSMKAIGYREFFDFYNNGCSRGELIESIKKDTRNYAKRQITWFKKTPGIKWFEGAQPAYEYILNRLKQ